MVAGLPTLRVPAVVAPTATSAAIDGCSILDGGSPATAAEGASLRSAMFCGGTDDSLRQ